MKKTIIIFVSFICLFFPFIAEGRNLPGKGDWPRNVIRSDTTITLTGHVALYGTITVSSGCTLTIINNTTIDLDKDGVPETYKRIRAISKMNTDANGNNTTSQFDGIGFNFNRFYGRERIAMFLVEEGATLKLLGKSDEMRVSINGGSGGGENRRYWNGEYLTHIDTDKNHPILNGGAICTVGNVIMEHTLIYDVYSEFQGAAIQVPAVEGKNIKTGSITMTDCEIRDCMACHGAAIMLKNQDATLNTDPDECAVTLTDVKIHHCYAISKNEQQDGTFTTVDGGGIIRSNGNVVSNLKLTRVHIYKCKSEGHGSALYWNGHGLPGTTCTMDNCTFEYNNAAKCGGGMVLESSFEFIGSNNTDVDYNKAGEYGGGAYIMAYNAASDNSTVVNLEMMFNENVRIRYNEAGMGGGGIAFQLDEDVTLAKGSTINMAFDGAIINDNKVVSGSGGGIYFDSNIRKDQEVTIKMNFDDGYLRRNNAKTGNGGGIFCTIPSAETAGYEISVPTLYLNGGDISKNNAINGAGIYVDRQIINSLESATGVNIWQNKATGHGGGIHISNGGSLNLSAGTIENNSALNGGGIYIGENGTMAFGKGLIRNNSAVSGGAAKNFTTAYHLTADELIGIGGGIFLDSGATLDFTDDKTLGLYGNLADYGADDIFANGNGTTIDLPDISQMQLSGFDVPTDELHWVEDYPTKDTEYDQGTNINTSDTATDELPERYRDAINALHQVYTIPGGQSLKCYTCLALGYELIFITIRKAGLENGDSAIFEIADAQHPEQIYMMLRLTGDGNPEVSRRVAIYSGEWVVSESGWSWTYEGTAAITRDINGTSPEQDRIFTFTNTPKNNTTLNDEAIVVNTMTL